MGENINADGKVSQCFYFEYMVCIISKTFHKNIDGSYGIPLWFKSKM